MIKNNTILSFYLWVCHCAVALMLFQCASPGSIQGGPKDDTPPLVDTLASSPNPTLNFNRQDIVIYFNEWVQLEDPYQQIFISPPLKERPNYKLKGKSLVIEMDREEVLAPNSTYIINLGKSIVDLNEKNPLADYQYVFSTGDYLDSLSFEGKAMDAITGEPLENISVMLFDNLSDTAITTVTPSYFARTNAEGEYSFQHLRAGQFQLIGFQDESQDFKYDAETEPFGFVKEPIFTDKARDSAVIIPISLGRLPVYLDDVDTSYRGLIRLTYTDNIRDTAMLRISMSDSLRITRRDKVIEIWYQVDELPVEVISQNTTGLKDTIRVVQVTEKLPPVEEIKITKIDANLLGNRPLRLLSSWPIEDLNLDLIHLRKNKSTEDLLSLDSFQIDLNELTFFYPWQADSSYRIDFLPDAIQFKDNVLHDSLKLTIKPVTIESLSAIELKFIVEDSLSKANQWIVELMQKDKQINRYFINDLKEPFRISQIKPGDYQLRVIKDENRNGMWDAARYYEKKQAEEILNVDLGTIRVNWIQETEIKIP